MNANLFKILKKIIATQGESILSDPQRLQAVFSDLAKNEPKEDRIAFGRCIEMGFFNELKRTQTEQERQKLKITLANKMQTKTGIDKSHCDDALDLLEATMFNPSPNIPFGLSFGKIKSLSNRTIIFGIAGALGGFVGDLVLEAFQNDEAIRSFWGIVISMGVWAAFIGLGISIGLLVAQSIYLKKTPVLETLGKTAIIGTLLGAAAGSIAQIIFAKTYEISYLVEIISRIVCWGIMGWGVGWGVSIFVPNFPRNRAMGAGFLGGLIGGVLFRATFSIFHEVMGRIIGIIALGFFIGLTISYIEEALRTAWLTVIWGKNETKTVSLGQNPILFGSSSEANIYLSNDMPVRLSVQIEGTKVVMYDKTVNQRRVLQNGDRVDLGKISFVVNTKK